MEVSKIDAAIRRLATSGLVTAEERAQLGALLRPSERSPQLGLATTRQLLKEIAARGRAEIYYRQLGDDMTMGAMNLLDTLPGSMLDYRTVDGKGGDGDGGAQAGERGGAG